MTWLTLEVLALRQEEKVAINDSGICRQEEDTTWN